MSEQDSKALELVWRLQGFLYCVLWNKLNPHFGDGMPLEMES